MGILPWENCKICAFKMPFLCILRSQSVEIPHTQNYRKLMLGCQKGKNSWETTEKGQQSAKKTGETKKRKSFKNWENIKREWEAGNICQKINGRFLTKTGGLEYLAFLTGWHSACCPRLRQLEMAYSWLLFGWPMMIIITINGYLLNLEIDLVLEMFADTG